MKIQPQAEQQDDGLEEITSLVHRHVISKDGLKTDPDKVRTTCKKETMSPLGLDYLKYCSTAVERSDPGQCPTCMVRGTQPGSSRREERIW